MSSPVIMLPRTNVEVKLRVADLRPVLERARAAGASFQWQRRQEDVFFAVPRGRLKLRREEGSVPHLVAYFREDRPEARESRYVIVPCPEAELLQAALESTVGIAAVVRKKRTLLTWRTVRIHLDEVEGLGPFVELEAVVSGREGAEEGRRELESLLEKLDLLRAERLPCAYVDLLCQGRQPLGGQSNCGRPGT
ncbi:MAG: class IV adenylate cyclase [candidate division KSB1 bacterium]|nr:class IV adenylate cyclase [candidate division KSB1 bacterium]